MYIVRVFIILTTLIFSGCIFRAFDPDRIDSYSRHLRRAEQHQRQKNYGLAILDYKAHIQSRLDDSVRAEWENPYFYYLIIGDLYLKQENVDLALKSYDYADNKGVDSGLISDRYRMVANWLTSKGEYKQAIELLNKHRNKDELLYDMMLDRLAREMVALEEKGIIN